MLPEDKFFRTQDKDRIWQRYCGFFDLSLEEFMKIQYRLLMEQIELVADSPLGKKILKGKRPQSVEEFRRLVPLTTYEDYEPHLSQQQEDVLTEKPYYWCHSSGRGGYFKWLPYTHRGFEAFAKRALSAVILAAANYKGEVNLHPGTRMLLLMPPRPYTSGSAVHYLSQRFSIISIPPEEEAGEMEFDERIAAGFRIALRTGVDVIFSIASVLVKAGESMAEQAQGMRFSLTMLRPPVLTRLVRAWLTSKIARRTMLPKDIWKAKAILAGGTDASIYRNQIAHYWGQIPYEVYGSTEAFPMALQGLNRKWLTFIPDAAFWEFIPEEEWHKSRDNPEYQPATVLLDEVEPGKTFEVVLTQLYGMPLLRYRIGDLVTFVALRDEEAGIELPQLVFKARADEIIALAGLAELDEGIVWQAIANCGLKYEDWSARKEYEKDQSYLSLYLELKEEREAGEVEKLVDQQLKALDVDYRDVGTMLGLQPVRVTFLTPGTFQRYYEEKRKEGADLAHLKPPHMNASDTIIQRLLQLSQEGGGGT